MSNHPLNNILILCTVDNKEQLAEFINNHNMSLTSPISSIDLEENFYYGIENNKFSHTPKSFIDLYENTQTLKCEYITLEKAINRFGTIKINLNPLIVNKFIQLDNNVNDLKEFFIVNGAIIGDVPFNREGYFYGVSSINDTCYVSCHTYDELNTLPTLDNPITIGDLKTIKDCFTATKTFPRIMWVKMNTVSTWRRAVVIAFARGKYITWANYNNLETLSDYVGNASSEAYITDWYDIAIEEDQVKAVTKEEIASMLNITVENLIIK